MRDESIMRQVALVGYGSRFLRGELALEEWYRHGAFFDARLQFRTLPDSALLADDFTVWLVRLKRSGAVRLSLHLSAALGLGRPPVQDRGDCAIVVHFTDSHQVWSVGVERATWRDDVEPGAHAAFPDAAGYAGELDSYWCCEHRPGSLAVAETDWRTLAASIAADLDIEIPSNQVTREPYAGGSLGAPVWSRLPLFPYTRASSFAHQVLATLMRQQAKFANDTHGKNDTSPYGSLSEQAAAEMDAWGVRLDGLLVDVLLRCANETRGRPNFPFKEYGDQAPVPPPDFGATGSVTETSTALSQHGTVAGAAQRRSPSGKAWGRGLAFAVVFSIISLFIAAIANIIAAFPWLAALLGLPVALYSQFKTQEK